MKVRVHITKSRSNHYTVTVRVDGMLTYRVGKLQKHEAQWVIKALRSGITF